MGFGIVVGARDVGAVVVGELVVGFGVGEDVVGGGVSGVDVELGTGDALVGLEVVDVCVGYAVVGSSVVETFGCTVLGDSDDVLCEKMLFAVGATVGELVANGNFVVVVGVGSAVAPGLSVGVLSFLGDN